MENKAQMNEYEYILNMEALPEFDETTGEFSWNNNDTNLQKNIKNNESKNNQKDIKDSNQKDQIQDKLLFENKINENATKYIEELTKILNN